MKKIVRGNDLTLQIPVSKMVDGANAESVRVSNEAARVNAETLRAHAEEKRVEAETAREKAMTDTVNKCVAAATLKVSYNAEEGTIELTTEQ